MKVKEVYKNSHRASLPKSDKRLIFFSRFIGDSVVENTIYPGMGDFIVAHHIEYAREPHTPFYSIDGKWNLRPVKNLYCSYGSKKLKQYFMETSSIDKGEIDDDWKEFMEKDLKEVS